MLTPWKRKKRREKSKKQEEGQKLEGAHKASGMQELWMSSTKSCSATQIQHRGERENHSFSNVWNGQQKHWYGEGRKGTEPGSSLMEVDRLGEKKAQRLLVQAKLFGKRCGMRHQNTTSEECEMSLLWHEYRENGRPCMASRKKSYEHAGHVREMRATSIWKQRWHTGHTPQGE